MPAQAPFKNSLLLSLCLHGALFGAAALLVTVLRTADPGMDIDSIDFVFLPAEEEREQSSQVDTGEPEPRQGAQQTDLPATPSPPAITPEADNTTGQNTPPRETSRPLPETGENNRDDAALAAPQPNYLRPDVLRSELRGISEYSPVPLRGRNAFRAIDQPRDSLKPATLSMSEKEQKELLKHLKRLTENFDVNTPGDVQVTWRHKNAMYTFTLRHKPSDSQEDFDELLVDITKEEQGLSLSTQLRMQRLAFSHFAKFVDYWDPNVAVHDDEFDGRFHSNTPFMISHSHGKTPRFRGKVTAPDYRFSRASSFAFMRKDSIFLGGLETGTKAIRMPKKIDILRAESNRPDSTFCLFEQETWITFHRDGTFSFHHRDGRNREKRRIPEGRLLTLYGTQKAPLRLRGVVCGKIMVYSQNKIIIEGDLIYKRHPELHRDADDYLGLVSEKDIEIAPPKITGPGDLRIHAAIYARRMFRVRHFYKKNDGACLYVYGSLTAGMISATEPRYGTRIRFDRRLQQRRPAYFPLTDRFEVKEWKKEWHLSPPVHTLKTSSANQNNGEIK